MNDSKTIKQKCFLKNYYWCPICSRWYFFKVLKKKSENLDVRESEERRKKKKEKKKKKYKEEKDMWHVEVELT